MRRLAIPLVALVVVGIVVLGLTQTGGQKKGPDRLSLPEMQRALQGAPPQLAAVYSKGNTVVGGSTKAFQRQVDALRGHAIVINKWASWCAPCRGEFPVLQSASVAYGKRVAFVGLDSKDNDGDAGTFLRHFPVPYPSYVDRNARVAQKLEIGQFYPTTMFYDARGKMQYIHQGPYTSHAAFAADIERYALGRPQ
jgi:cytochrome c biogenesis protein CcmG, thiol:disulfide interchange protein DsbE